MSDISVENHGTIWTFTPTSEAGKAFCTDRLEVEDWQWLGESFGIDWRPARDLTNFMVDEGLEIELAGFRSGSDPYPGLLARRI